MKWRFWQISTGWQLQCQHVGIGVWNKALLSEQKLEWGAFISEEDQQLLTRLDPDSQSGRRPWLLGEIGSWHEAAECNVIKKRRRGKKAKGRTMNLVAWCHHYETLAWYQDDEVIARAVCEFMSLAHAQFSVSPLRRATNENGWRASSGPCVRVSEGTHVHAAVSWWLLAERRGSDDLQVPEREGLGGEAGSQYVGPIRFPCVWFMFPLTTAVCQTLSHEPAQIQTATHQMSISKLDALSPAVWVCAWVWVVVSATAFHVVRQKWYPAEAKLTKFSLSDSRSVYKRRNGIQMPPHPQRIFIVYRKQAKRQYDTFFFPSFFRTTVRINVVNVVLWMRD